MTQFRVGLTIVLFTLCGMLAFAGRVKHTITTNVSFGR